MLDSAAAALRPTSGSVRRTLFFLAMPVLGEQLLNSFVGIFDTYLAGRISAEATSAIGLAAYVSWLAQMMVMLVGTGTTALVARYTGTGERTMANRFANQSMTLSAALGVVSFAGLYVLAPAFAAYSNMTDEASRMAIQYLRIDAVGHMFMSVTLVGCAALRGIGNMRTPMLIFVVINAVNVLAASALVFGLGPLPRLGVTGIVTGTIIAKTVGATLLLSVLFRGHAGLKLRLAEMSFRWSQTRRILRIGLPAAADAAVMWLGQFVFIAIISNLADPPLGTAYFAAHVIAVRVEAFTYLPAVAWARLQRR